jgi:putative ATPase
MPDELVGHEYYHPNERGYEHELGPRLERIRSILHGSGNTTGGRDGNQGAAASDSREA